MSTSSTWLSASCTRGRVARHGVAAAITVLGMLCGAPAARAVLPVSQEEALEEAFGPSATITRETEYLTEDQVATARALAGTGVDVSSALVVRYVATRAGELIGTAYFDAHLVRTLAETVMILVTPDGRVSHTEILSFREPREYLPPDRWRAQFLGRALDADLAVKRGIHGITGATLSARAFTRATRRILALHQVIEESSVPRKTDSPERRKP